MDNIYLGQYVTIERADGRFHEALVTKINESVKLITVEWYECGETRGKKVALNDILALNPDIVQNSKTLRNPMQEQGPKETPEQEEPAPESIRSANNGIMGRCTNRFSFDANSKSYVSSYLSENVAIPPVKEYMCLRNKVTGTVVGAGGIHNGGGMSTSRGNPLNISTVSEVGSLAARYSYVVRKVDELEENHGERRAGQTEIKREKSAFKIQDSEYSNWETAQMIREYKSTLECNPLVDGQVYKEHLITVCVRKRPLSRKELERNEIDVISVPNKDTLTVHEPRSKVDLTRFLEHHKFRFDYTFDDQCDNYVVYKYTAQPLVQTIFDGAMATCFAYGQTGSGKTHTMGGAFNGKVQDCNNGIYAMAAKDVFSYLKDARYRTLNLIVCASFFEIYSGKVFDLLADRKELGVLEDGNQEVHVVGLTEKLVGGAEDVLELIQHGTTVRKSGQTSANANSSRSHAIFQIILRPSGCTKTHGKFSIVDLAGNERGADTISKDRQTRFEGSEINKSLLALKECIRALGKRSAHLPFRLSKLTQVLRDSFIGENSKTCMIAMISPGLSSCKHTLNTLHYADRVKELVVRAVADGDNNNGNHAQNSESALSLWQLLNKYDKSNELRAQHPVITDLIFEEAVKEQHKEINDFMTKFLPESLRLYQQTNILDYDQNAYCEEGEIIFGKLADYATACRDLMADLRAKLAKY